MEKKAVATNAAEVPRRGAPRAQKKPISMVPAATMLLQLTPPSNNASSHSGSPRVNVHEQAIAMVMMITL
jgi:hypothetical protein